MVAERVRAAVQRAGLPPSRAARRDCSPCRSASRAATARISARCWPEPTRRSTRPSAQGATASWPPTERALCRCRRARARARTRSPVPRHLRSMLAVSRAAASGQGVMPVLEALAEAMRSELSFQVVAVNLLDAGDRRSCASSSCSATPRPARRCSTRHAAVASGRSCWRPARTIARRHLARRRARTSGIDGAAVWTPPGVAPPGSDAWHPEDMLLLPLRTAAGEIIAIVSVDQPLLGRRPSEAEIGVLMAVADHAGLALEQVQRERRDRAHGQSDELRLAAMMLLAETLDLRDPRTALHARTVGQLRAHDRARARARGGPRRADPRRRRPPRPRQARDRRRDPAEARTARRRGMAGDAAPSGGRARGSSSTPGCATSPRGCAPTTSGWTGRAIPLAHQRATGSRSRRGSWPSPTPTRR